MNSRVMKTLSAVFLICLFFTSSTVAVVAKETLRKRDAKAKNGMVATAHPLASKVGIDILQAGGNAVDAAVAIGFSLGVVEPNASGIGGGGFMLIRFAKTGEYVFIDFREKAPAAATETMFPVDENGKPRLNSRGFRPSVIGGKSVAVPGEVAGLLAALEEYGTLEREKVIAPAIKQAREGIVISNVLADLIAKHYEELSTFPGSATLYLTDDLPKEAGEKIVNPDLAKSLSLIAEKGRDGFYKGPVAHKIVDTVNEDGGIMTMADLAHYKVRFRAPVTGTYRGYGIVSAPPASSGGTHVIELLNIMENFDLGKMDPMSPEALHAWAEAMKLMYADRGRYMADTDFVEVPLKGLTSKEYAKKQFEHIDLKKPVEKREAGDPWPNESGSTTHFSVIDAEGNMVACTKTINHFFGSAITVPGTGILLNDQMDDFDKRPGQANSVQGRKRPLSSMSPTLILKEGKPVASLGTPGGKRIITTVAEIISYIIDYNMDIQSAINAPRINNYEKGALKIESRIPQASQQALIEMGHKLDVKGDYDLYFGGAQGVVIDQKTGELHGGADPRRDGQAMGF